MMIGGCFSFLFFCFLVSGGEGDFVGEEKSPVVVMIGPAPPCVVDYPLKSRTVEKEVNVA